MCKIYIHSDIKTSLNGLVDQTLTLLPEIYKFL